MTDYQERQELESDLRDAVLDVNQAKAAASLAVATRDEIIVRMVTKEDYSMYRVAQLADVSQQRVAKIVEAAGQ